MFFDYIIFQKYYIYFLFISFFVVKEFRRSATLIGVQKAFEDDINKLLAGTKWSGGKFRFGLALETLSPGHAPLSLELKTTKWPNKNPFR